MSDLHSGYKNNVIAYANTFGSSKFVAAVALDESAADDHIMTASLNMPINDSLDFAVALLKDRSGSGPTATKVAVKWNGDGMGAVLQYESLDAGLGDIDNDLAAGVQSADESLLYLSYHMATGEDSIVAMSYGMNDSDAAAVKDGSYIAIGVKKTMSKYVSTHAGWKKMSDGVAGSTTAGDTSFVGAGIKVAF